VINVISGDVVKLTHRVRSIGKKFPVK
jgi:hypothetical protein